MHLNHNLFMYVFLASQVDIKAEGKKKKGSRSAVQVSATGVTAVGVHRWIQAALVDAEVAEDVGAVQPPIMSRAENHRPVTVLAIWN